MANEMTEIKEIPWSQLTPTIAGLVTILYIVFHFVGKFIPFLQPISKFDKEAVSAMDKLVSFIENTLSGLMGRQIDATNEIHRDLASMKSECHRTHEKVGELLDTRGKMVDEIESSNNKMIEHAFTHHFDVKIAGIISRLEVIEKKFSSYQNKLDL